MQALRNSKLIASLVLVWFALFLGSAIASSVMQPGSLQMVCSSDGGMKVVDTSNTEGDVQTPKSMDCPLCASVAAPPPPCHAVAAPVPSALAIGVMLQGLSRVRIAMDQIGSGSGDLSQRLRAQG